MFSLINDVSVEEAFYDGTDTKTNTFVLPMIGIKKGYLRNFFLNSYIREDRQYNVDDPNYRPLFLAIKKPNKGDVQTIERWFLLDQSLKSKREYTTSFYGGKLDETTDIIVYEYDVNRSPYAADYDLFLQGKYSEFSQLYKHGKIKIVGDKFVSIFPEKLTNGAGEIMSNIAFQIIHKDPALRESIENTLQVELSPDVELWDAPDIWGRECFKYKFKLA